MNLKPEQIPDEVVDEALFCAPWNSSDEPMAMPIDLMAMGSPERLEDARSAMRHALAAALPVLLVKVGFAAPESLSPSNRRMSWFDVWRTQHPPFTTPIYALPTQDTPNE